MVARRARPDWKKLAVTGEQEGAAGRQNGRKLVQRSLEHGGIERRMMSY